MIRNKGHQLLVVILAVYLLLPLIATFMYSLAGDWSTTILPESWTFSWYIELYQEKRFFQSLFRSTFVIASAVVLSLFVMILAMFIVLLYFPKKEKLLKMISMLPYGVPAVASAIGLLNIYSSSVIKIVGTPWILIGVYAISILPFVYQGIRNSIYTVNAVELIQAAELLGASKTKAAISVVFPNITKGILSAALLSIAMLFGEFAFANLLVGGQFETLQIYLYQQLSKNGHITSAIVITYYLIILIITGLLLRAESNKRGKRAVNVRIPLSKMLDGKLVQSNGIEGDVK